MKARHQPTPRSQSVVVGLSGGVDSSVAALLLKEEGYAVTGLTLRLWNDLGSTCGKPGFLVDSVARAAAVAQHLGIPHLVVDAAEMFDREVVDYFVADYERGRTPNPCVKCNATIKLPLLLATAHRLGATRIATGHYARLTGKPSRLSRGVYRRKDQSYVLAQVPAAVLEQVLLPLGGTTKEQVRQLAVARGLADHVSKESQEICFLAGDDYRGLLKTRLGERPGLVVDTSGRPLARHSGTYNYTVGQRRGLGVARQQPLYVVAVDSDHARVVAGAQAEGAIGSLRISDPVVHRISYGANTTVQVRSMGHPVPAHMTADDTISLLHPTAGVAAGQTAVLYDGDDVVLAGTIISTEPWGPNPAKPTAAGPQ